MSETASNGASHVENLREIAENHRERRDFAQAKYLDEAADALASRAPAPAAAGEVVAVWMTARGYATGHGDTIEDMLAELEAQAKATAEKWFTKACEQQALRLVAQADENSLRREVERLREALRPFAEYGVIAIGHKDGEFVLRVADNARQPKFEDFDRARAAFSPAAAPAQAGGEWKWEQSPLRKMWTDPLPGTCSYCGAKLSSSTPGSGADGDGDRYKRALEEMRDRDDVNGSLHKNYRDIIDRALAAAPKAQTQKDPG